MPEEEKQSLIDTFKEFYGSWKDNIESWKKINDHQIEVRMKTGDFFNSGAVYIFGDEGPNKWFMRTVKAH